MSFTASLLDANDTPGKALCARENATIARIPRTFFIFCRPIYSVAVTTCTSPDAPAGVTQEEGHTGVVYRK